MHKKLSNWKMDSLSLEGHRVLVQSSLATMPVYTMQALALPVGTCKDIHRICRNFLWGDSERKKKIHLVNWTEVCTRREKGGLGIHKATDFNTALLVKLAWQVLDCPEKLWVKVISEKYIKDGNFFTASIPSHSSWSWRSIVKGPAIVELGASWRVGNGKLINFWHDWWVGLNPIGLNEGFEIPEDVMSTKVRDFILESRDWDIPKLEEVLPHDKINEVRATPIYEAVTAEDTMVWAETSTGNFSISLAFLMITGTTEDDEDLAWVWRLKCMEKVKTFI